MAYREASLQNNGDEGLSAFRSEGREPGARRRKLAGYLKAANELRHSYTQSIGSRHDDYGSNDGIPGAFPEAAVQRNGDEEMIIFPSYARQHIKHKVG